LFPGLWRARRLVAGALPFHDGCVTVSPWTGTGLYGNPVAGHRRRCHRGDHMGFRVRRRIRIGPGVTLNVGKRGVSTSVGVRGAHVTVGRRSRATVGIPGTGLSYTTQIGGGRRRPVSPPPPSAVAQPAACETRTRSGLFVFLHLCWSLLTLMTVVVFMVVRITLRLAVVAMLLLTTVLAVIGRQSRR
jgi:hypothetical protein